MANINVLCDATDFQHGDWHHYTDISPLIDSDLVDNYPTIAFADHYINTWCNSKIGELLIKRGDRELSPPLLNSHQK
jgi:hypothetical protein